MKQRKASTDSDPGQSLQRLNEYLQRNFPDFFAAARFQVRDDDYYLYARFGQYLVRVIEQNRASGRTINRGFALLNQMARDSLRHPSIRRMLVSGPLEYIVDAPRRGLWRASASRPKRRVISRVCVSNAPGFAAAPLEALNRLRPLARAP